MCDTLGFVGGGKAIFAKNSDRSPNEPQVLEYYPSSVHTESSIEATYIKVPQSKETHAVLLSRPTCLWGAEIGVNDCGVCIGNEAVWTKGKYEKSGLTGMDLLRLGLERSENAKEAISVITDMLERYGQGGNCAYDHDFFYDNSFLIMDRSELFVLETADRNWVYKKYDKATISNRLSIGSNGDAYSSGSPVNFAGRYSDIVYNLASGSATRQKQTAACISDAKSTRDMMAALRTHKCGVQEAFSKGSVSSTCMHFGGVVGDHTTASMGVDLKAGRTIVWATGSSLPCVSLFKPWVFGEAPSRAMREGKKYWYEQEQFRRSLIGKEIPDQFFAEREDLEQRWAEAADAHEANLSERCFEEEAEFYSRWKSFPFRESRSSPAFNKRWNKKNAVFGVESVSE